MSTLTIKRAEPREPIRIPIYILEVGSDEAVAVQGLFDTGLDHTIISREVAAAVQLKSTGRTISLRGIDGGVTGDTALVSFAIDNDQGGRWVCDGQEMVILDGCTEAVLMGRDFLEKFDLTIARDGTVTLSA